MNSFLIVIILFFIFLGISIFFYFQWKKWRLKKADANLYLGKTIRDVALLRDYIISATNQLQVFETYTFAGASEAQRKLKQIEKTLNFDIENALIKIKKSMKFDDIKKVSTDVEILNKKAESIVREISDNYNIDLQIRKYLEKQVEDIKRKVTGAIPQAQRLIDIIRQESPDNVWRNFDYNNLTSNIDVLFEKSERSVKDAINSLNSYMYDEAKQHATTALSYADNAVKYVQSIFDVNAQINEGKELYNRFIGRLPDMINSAKSVATNYDSAEMSNIDLKYKELKEEIQKNKLSDWILIGAIIKFIMSSCKKIESQQRTHNSITRRY